MVRRLSQNPLRRQRFLMGLLFGANLFGKFQFCRRFFHETRLRLFRNQFDVPIEVQAGMPS